MQLDDDVCLCFGVSQRKVINFIRVEAPRAPSQLAECFGAGTGCGWCRPYLCRLFDAVKSAEAESANETSAKIESELGELLDAAKSESPWLAPQDYAAARRAYLKRTGRRPPNDS